MDAAQEGRLKLLRFLVHNKLPFTRLDDPTWHQLAAFRISTISSTAIKRVLQQEVMNTRVVLAKRLRTAPGVSVALDEWSDLAMFSWL